MQIMHFMVRIPSLTFENGLMGNFVLQNSWNIDPGGGASYVFDYQLIHSKLLHVKVKMILFLSWY